MAGRSKETLELEVKTTGTKQAASAFKDVADSADKNLGKAEKSTSSFTSRIGSALQSVAAKIPGLNKIIGPGLQDAAGLGMGALAGAAGAAGVAVAKFATDSVNKFKDLGLEIGRFRDATGTTAEQASAFVEMAKDLGISADTIQGGIGKMNKAIGSTPQLFENAGIEIARTKDGAVDVNQTFLNTVDALNAIQDPTQKAALAAKIFGKGWQSMAEIIEGGSGKIRESFASISKEKLFDDKEIEKARRLRDALDKFHDSVEDIQLAIGENLAPALADAATSFAKLIEAAKPLIGVLDPIIKGVGGVADVFSKVSDGVTGLVDHLGPLKPVLNGLVTGAKDFTRSMVDPIGAAVDLGGKIKGIFDHSDENKQKAEQMAAANKAMGDRWAGAAEQAYQLQQAQEEVNTQDAIAAAEEYEAAVAAEAATMQKLADTETNAAAAINARIDAQRAATDSLFASQKAQRDFGDAVAKADKVLGDSKSSLSEMADAIDTARGSAVSLSDAAVKLAQDQAKAKGETLGAKAAIDIQNQSLLASARSASGPVRNAIAQYITQLNGIDPVKATEIQALINKGDIAGAEAALNTTSRTRSAAINADAHTANAERDLNNVARSRIARIDAAVARGGSQNSDQRTSHAAGGTVDTPFQIVGEHGPELATLPVGTKITPAAQTAALLKRGGGDVNVQIIMPAGADPRDVAAAIRRTAARNGS